MSELDPIHLHVGSVLRDIRKRHGMTLDGLADKLGLTYQQIQKYETGKNRMSASTLYQAAIILDVSPICFFPPAAQDAPADAALSAQAHEITLSIEGHQRQANPRAAAGARRLASEVRGSLIQAARMFHKKSYGTGGLSNIHNSLGRGSLTRRRCRTYSRCCGRATAMA